MLLGPPRTHLFGSENYSVMLSEAGSGYSRLGGLAVTRWREDPTCDPWGYYLLLRDAAQPLVWSAAYQPMGGEPDSYEAVFFEGGAQIDRRDGTLRTRTEFLVSSEADAEVRRVSLRNESAALREIDVTTYAEVVLSEAAADTAHPAFSKMFVQTEFDVEHGALLATRRPRDPGQAQLWMVHFAVPEGGAPVGPQFETDRARFLGRGNGLRHAASMRHGVDLSNTQGTVLDPVMSLRYRLRIAAGETVAMAFWTAVASSREQALALVDKFGDPAAFERTKKLSLAKAQTRLQELNLDAKSAQLYQAIAAPLVYADPRRRAPAAVLAKNHLGQSALWVLGISGDHPMVLMIVDDEASLEGVKQLLQAQHYWQTLWLTVDVVVVNEAPAAGAAALQSALDTAVKATGAQGQSSPRGAAVILRANALAPEQRVLLETAARVVFRGSRSLGEQLVPQPERPSPAAPEQSLWRQLAQPPPAQPPLAEPPVSQPPNLQPSQPALSAPAPLAPLEFFNGLGGFDAKSHEYVVILDGEHWTPAPWINVVANPQFGVLISADGTGSTWSLNAQQNQLTPWCNDPVSNSPAEVIYIRDQQSGELWSATPLPIRQRSSTYNIRHGFGYSRCEHLSHGVAVDLLQFVPREASIKISRLKLANRSAKARELSVTHYVDWVLGNQNNRAAPFIVTQIDPETGALLARNPWPADFSSRIAFMDMSGRQLCHTGDRTEFLGRHGSLEQPAALAAALALSGHVGGGFDPCGAMQTTISLGAGESVELVFLLGEESSADAAVALIQRYRTLDLDAALKEVTDFWESTVGALQVKTPDRSMDILLNGWLLYQTLACRVWARTAFYQSSGAYGFRDQLQDVMALCVSAPAIAREHILRAGARQFAAGDVQHWWLANTGQGIKTRIADDRIWLAFVAAHYIEVTADLAVLDQEVSFLVGGPLEPGILENFSAPAAGEAATLFEHCVRALDSSLNVGAHGLPLFGTGDWNDGMNRVGVAGRGESVWMGWFLYATLLRFALIADKRGESIKTEQWRRHALLLQQAMEREAWDGDWYRRGYYDDGTPLGSALSDECRIDSIAQSWAVISAAAMPERAARAMSAVDAQLVDRRAALVQLFTPAFDHTAHDPGYIKAYPPGLRENGGQYTHAATWSILAFAALGDGDKAAELFALMNPINHADSSSAIQLYQVEPYVICADVYTAPGHVGRGGWTWYTGSAGWMYRAGTEGILGLQLRGPALVVEPCIPRGWDGYECTYRHGTSCYEIEVRNPNGVNRGVVRASLDGTDLAGPGCEVKLIDDGRRHQVVVTLG
jgi:cyclic beta-1,2-glucan synthetase